ncbi:hypothetical protein RSAG8_02631, partial [Rhizoctonia solani AG-8 WAC10335]
MATREGGPSLVAIQLSISNSSRDNPSLQMNSESKDYSPKNPRPSHWTQVVWKQTIELRCAVKQCAPGTNFDANYGVSNIPSLSWGLSWKRHRPVPASNRSSDTRRL